MSEQVQEVQEKEETVVTMIFDVAHKTFLAGLGAVSIVQDELKKGLENSGEFAGKLIERGEEISNERREQIAAEAEKRQEQAQGFGDDVSGRFSDTTNKLGETYKDFSSAALHRMNVPTSEDVQALSKQISALSRKVDRVRKEQKELAEA
jgi:poly(hydroxyalkanoate) granule-associated protein